MAEADHRGWDQLLVCGDLCFPGPEPLGVWKRLVQLKAVCVQGLGDRALAHVNPRKLSAASESERARIERLRATHQELGEVIVARLARLPQSAGLPLESGHHLTVVHGSPVDPTEALTADMDDNELSALLGAECGDIVVCGASHTPFQREVGDVRIVNVGSVGEAPGGGYAHGSIVDATPLGIAVQQFEVELPRPLDQGA